MARRYVWLVGIGVVLVAVALAIWRAANGATASTAVLAGASVVFIAAVGLTANQGTDRRRVNRAARR